MSDFDYRSWWENYYSTGGTSGSGSYGLLAEFKAEIINNFIKEHQIESVIEFGCGDGNQLSYMEYKKYLGLDVARPALDLCINKFSEDKSKSFLLYDPRRFMPNGIFDADLVVCLDVLYHITDEIDYRKTLTDIFSCTKKYVILYDKIRDTESHSSEIKYRNIVPYLQAVNNFEVLKIIPQRYQELSSADFIFIAHKTKELI